MSEELDQDVFCFKISNGSECVVDVKYKDLVEKYKWHWMKNRGVAAFCKKQTILLHNMIAPFSRVSFKDGNKLNCRRSNLVDWKKSSEYGNSKRRGGLWIRRDRVEMYTYVIKDGERFQWRTCYRFGRKRTKEEALSMAKDRLDDMLSLSRESFIEYVKSGRTKKTTHEIISEWSVFNGDSYSMSAVCQEGMWHNRETF